MNVVATFLEGVLILEPRVFQDERGWFLETWHQTRYATLGIDREFVQDNVSISRKGVVRGLHFQNPQPQGKLVSVLSGSVFDVAVDLRVGSPTFARWLGVELTAESGRQLWIPEGFAHGFAATTDGAVLSYKCTSPYAPDCEQTILWSDPEIGIEWPVTDPVLSHKDAAARPLREIARDALFDPKG